MPTNTHQIITQLFKCTTRRERTPEVINGQIENYSIQKQLIVTKPLRRRGEEKGEREHNP